MIDFAAFTSRGEREYNEDFIASYVRSEGHVFAVADGLGGQGLGDKASRVAVTAVDVYTEGHKGLDTATLSECMSFADFAIEKKKQQLGLSQQMMTTLAVLYLSEDRACWSHIGDTRIYHFADSRLVKRSLDHSAAQLMIDIGLTTETDPRRLEECSTLTMCLGMPRSEEPEEEERLLPIEESSVGPGEDFLLCTDGFWFWLEDEEIEGILSEGRDAEWSLDAMISIVKQRSKGNNADNSSAILVRIK